MVTEQLRKRVLEANAIDEALRAIFSLWEIAIAHQNEELCAAAVTRILICTHDLGVICQRNGAKVPHELRERVRKCRNAACHIEADEADIGMGRNRFFVVEGKGVALQIDDISIEGEYEDDVAFFFGQNRVYAVRDLQKIIETAQALRKTLSPRR